MWTFLAIVFLTLMILSSEFRRKLFQLFADLAARYVAFVIALLVAGTMLRHMASVAGTPLH